MTSPKKTNDSQRQMMLHISLLTADGAKSESNSRWNSDAHNFGNFSTFAKLLDGVCMLHVVHGDSVDHYDSVILPGEEHQTETPWWRRKGHLIAVKRQRTVRSEAYCSRPSAGPPFSTSEMTMEVSPL